MRDRNNSDLRIDDSQDNKFFRLTYDWDTYTHFYGFGGDIVKIISNQNGYLVFRNLKTGDQFKVALENFKSHTRKARITNKEIIQHWTRNKGSWLWNDVAESDKEYIKAHHQFIGYQCKDYVIIYYHLGSHPKSKAVRRFRNQLLKELDYRGIGYMDEHIAYEI